MVAFFGVVDPARCPVQLALHDPLYSTFAFPGNSRSGMELRLGLEVFRQGLMAPVAQADSIRRAKGAEPGP